MPSRIDTWIVESPTRMIVVCTRRGAQAPGTVALRLTRIDRSLASPADATSTHEVKATRFDRMIFAGTRYIARIIALTPVSVALRATVTRYAIGSSTHRDVATSQYARSSTR